MTKPVASGMGVTPATYASASMMGSSALAGEAMFDPTMVASGVLPTLMQVF
ncbi:MAG: hypothetical protein HY540_02820 [Deltaproteobacteria bacterium]|nr:hypothetical protein [Deltaproteobacteria bacterium]